LRAVPQKPGNTVRIVCISDTHELHRELDIPPGDILIHAGDFTFMSQRPSKVADFDRWLGELPHPTKIVIPGNHDSLVESGTVTSLLNATLLINRGIESHGLKIWGSPLTSRNSGAFGCSDPEERRRIYAEIPPDADILITHGPPYGILDCEHVSSSHQGCRVLLETVLKLKPRLHVFGHVHGGHGRVTIGPTIFANAALFTELSDVDRRPLVFVIPVTPVGNILGKS
jgi:Icc-related predicted phosphoesterase